MDDLVLTAPAPVAPVPASRAAGLVPLADKDRTELDVRVETFVSKLVSLPTASPAFGEQASKLSSFGQREIVAANVQSNRFLDKPVRDMDGNAGVGADLVRLRGVIEDLDPARKGDLLKPRKLLGLIPFGNRIKSYFDQYQSAQSHISGILGSLATGRDDLLKDNAAIEGERERMWKAMGQLEQMIYMADALDKAIEDKAVELDGTDPAKAKALREDGLFQVRQRHQDLLVQMAVTVQGYLALDLVRKNNIELIKSVDRASSTTIGALRTAVTVAQALGNQRLVLNQITALNTTTAGIIEGTSSLLKSNSAAIQQQAASSTIPVETLKRAFQNVYDTMDQIDTFKVKALDSMRVTIDALSDETAKAKGRIAAAEGATRAQEDQLTLGAS